METILRSSGRHDRAPNSDEMTPQERLQRLADAFDTEPDWAEHLVMEAMAAEQERPAHPPTVASSEIVRKGSAGFAVSVCSWPWWSPRRGWRRNLASCEPRSSFSGCVARFDRCDAAASVGSGDWPAAERIRNPASSGDSP